MDTHFPPSGVHAQGAAPDTIFGECNGGEVLNAANLLSRGFGINPKSIWASKEITLSEKVVLQYLLSYLGGGQNTCWPSLSRIAKDLGRSCDRPGLGKNTIVQAIRGLVAKQAISITIDQRDNGSKSNTYKCLLIAGSRENRPQFPGEPTPVPGRTDPGSPENRPRFPGEPKHKHEYKHKQSKHGLNTQINTKTWPDGHLPKSGPTDPSLDSGEAKEKKDPPQEPRRAAPPAWPRRKTPGDALAVVLGRLPSHNLKLPTAYIQFGNAVKKMSELKGGRPSSEYPPGYLSHPFYFADQPWAYVLLAYGLTYLTVERGELFIDRFGFPSEKKYQDWYDLSFRLGQDFERRRVFDFERMEYVGYDWPEATPKTWLEVINARWTEFVIAQ